MDKTYTISEIEELTGINRRTIYFYVQEKLIPKPVGLGGGAKYTEDHLNRLMIISDFQKQHIKLNGIRERLLNLSENQITELAASIKNSDEKKETEEFDLLLDEVDHLIPNLEPIKIIRPIPHMDISFEKVMNSKIIDRKGGIKSISNELKETKWTHYKIADGFEVKISDELDRFKKHKYLKLLKIISKKIRD